jgi:hypothetical protein
MVGVLETHTKQTHTHLRVPVHLHLHLHVQLDCNVRRVLRGLFPSCRYDSHINSTLTPRETSSYTTMSRIDATGDGGAADLVLTYLVFFLPTSHSKWSLFGRLDPSHDRVGDGRPQQSLGWAAGAGLPSSASSTLTDSGANLI